jgi:hypothetical protein
MHKSNKSRNKQLKRRLESLTSKCYQYGKLDGVELALFISYLKKGEFYSYRSTAQLPWLRQPEIIVSVALC